MLYIPASGICVRIASCDNTPKGARVMIVKVRGKARLIGAAMLIRKIGVRIEGNKLAVAAHSLTEIEDVDQRARSCWRRRRYLATASWQPGVQISREDLFITAGQRI